MPLTEIYKTFVFDAAHRLPRVPEGHKCKQMHGHTYYVTFFFAGDLDSTLGWIVDYGDVSAAVGPILKQLDHKCLNDVWGLHNPTTELLAKWLWDRVKAILPQLSRVEVKESSTTGCIYSA